MKPLTTVIEPLEARIAPAAFVTYTDIDGDLVKITASKGQLDLGDLTFNGGGSAGQLAKLDLTDARFDGASIVFSVTKAGGGDGLVKVGLIKADGVDLDRVIVQGDLEKIVVGDADHGDTALKLLSAATIGRYRTGGTDQRSEIRGGLDALKVAGDFANAYLHTLDGGIGSISIGGSLAGNGEQDGGSIASDAKIGSVNIGGNMIGGDGEYSGSILSADKMGAVVIGKSVLGGAGADSGQINAGNSVASVKVGLDLRGGDGDVSGTISVFGKLGSLTVRRDVLGGYGDDSGGVHALVVGNVKIAGDLAGGIGKASGRVHSEQTLGGVTIGGSLQGGVGNESGQIYSYAKVGAAKIGKNLEGGSGDNSGVVTSNVIRAISVGESMHGGAGSDSGVIDAGALGTVKVGETVQGGAGRYSGCILSTLAGSVTIGGSLVGGPGKQSGQIAVEGDIGPIKIGRDFIGGSISGSKSLDGSGYIEAGRIASVTIGGSIFSGKDQSSGSLTMNASIRADVELGPVKVHGGILGNVSSGGVTPVIISAGGAFKPAPGDTHDVAIQSLTVGGPVTHASILAGYDTGLSPRGGDAQIGAVKVAGDWTASNIVAGVENSAKSTANFGASNDQLIAGGSDHIIARIASITIGGTVHGSVDTDDSFAFTAEQIGSFKSAGFTAHLTPASHERIPVIPGGTQVLIREV